MRKLILILTCCVCAWLPETLYAQQKQALTASATTCTTTNTSCLIVGIDPPQGGATFTISANASANTIQFESSGDGGTSWVALNVTPSNSTTAVTSTTGTGTWQANVAGYTNVRMRMSTLVGGSTTVSIIGSTASARAGGGGGVTVSGGGTVAAGAPQVTPNLQQIIIAKACPDSTSVNVTCFVVADDVQIVSDGSWSNASAVVTTGSSDPVFKSTGNIYPATCSTPSATCDVGKAEFGTANCAAGNPQQCNSAFAQGTILSITSAHVATMSSNSTRVSTAESMFAWGTNDNTALIAALTAAYTSKTPVQLTFPCGQMFFDHSLNSSGITRFNTSIGIKGCQGSTGTVLVPLPCFTQVGSSAGFGAWLDLAAGGGQSVTAWGFGDSARDLMIFDLGLDVNPGCAAYASQPEDLIRANANTFMENVWLEGSLWNVASAFPIYGIGCLGCVAVNTGSYVGGSFSCRITGTNTFPATWNGGYCGSSAFTGLTINDTSGTLNNIVTSGLTVGYAVGSAGGGSSNDLFGAAVNVTGTGTGTWTDTGSAFYGGMFASGGRSIFKGSSMAHNGAVANAFNLTNANAIVEGCGLNNVSSGFTAWLSASAGNFYDACPNFGLTPAASLSGTGAVWGSASATGTLQVIGNIVTSSCGTSTNGTLVAGSTASRGQFTLTIAGTPGTTCVETITFPLGAGGTSIAFSKAPQCTLVDTGGTGAFPTSIVNGTISTTSAAFTITGTLTNTQTEILQYNCSNP